jgi:outer membrane protein OmpA-like peptidoglycan-associated protein
MLRYLTYTIVCCFLTAQLLAQSAVNTKKSPRELVRDAEGYINRQQFKAAKIALETVVEQKSKFVVAYRLLGLVYTNLRTHSEAINAYEKLFELDPTLSKAAYYECAMAYMKNYRYDKALSYLNLYKNANSKDYKSDETNVQYRYNMYLDFEIQNCRFARTSQLVTNFEHQNLGTSINSAADEYLPTLTGDSRWLIFTSNRMGENILMSKLNKAGKWSAARSISKAINTPRNEGMAKLTVCGRTIYFSACGWENVQGGCDIFEADFDTQNDFAVVDDVRPSLGLNSQKWDSQPAISCDGKTMYFTSTRKGNIGGSDLWTSTLAEDGLWDPPTNMGLINTKGDEEAPYIAPDGKTLYFSSNGWPGFGDSDIFRTVLQEDGSWSKPVNLGNSVNTPHREAGIVVSPDGTRAYYASSQDGGFGGLDVYSIAINKAIAPEETNVMVDAYVYDAATKEPIENAQVKVGKSGTKKQFFETDENGRFFVCLPDNASYSYILMHPNYETYVGADFFKRTAGEATKKLELFLVPSTEKKEVQSGPKKKTRKHLAIYFDSGKYEITDIQKEQVQRMIGQFDQLGSVKLDVIGFADDVGNKAFNLSLSEERAKNVVSYLKSLGILQNQIDFRGGGVVQGDIAKHQKRRVEIKIITE